MSEKTVSPLNNPSSEKSDDDGFYHCQYCKWVTKAIGAYRTHVSLYHEAEVVAGGDKSLREGGDLVERNNRWLLAHGYVKCPWWPVPCVTKINPLMARVCKHLNDCPV